MVQGQGYIYTEIYEKKVFVCVVLKQGWTLLRVVFYESFHYIIKLNFQPESELTVQHLWCEEPSYQIAHQHLKSIVHANRQRQCSFLQQLLVICQEKLLRGCVTQFVDAKSIFQWE